VYIHEPWTAPVQVQRAAKCIIGVDYPKPMVNHTVVSKINHERMRQVYQQLNSYRSVKTPGNLQLLFNITIYALDYKLNS
jgi:hypothetical protein